VLRIGSRTAVTADHQLAPRLHRIGDEPRRLDYSSVDWRIVENGSQSRDGLTELLLYQILNVVLLKFEPLYIFH